jgi:hypothetical protein
MQELRLIKECIKEITTKYTLNNISTFSHSDFVQLSNDIFEISKTSISVSTLKRIWRAHC